MTFCSHIGHSLAFAIGPSINAGENFGIPFFTQEVGSCRKTILPCNSDSANSSEGTRIGNAAVHRYDVGEAPHESRYQRARGYD